MLNADPKAKQQINFAENLERDGNTQEAKETKTGFLKRNRESIITLFCFNITSM